MDAFIAGIRQVLVKDKVENSTVFLNDITGSAFLITVDYFTSPIAMDEFNSIKQRVNLDVLLLMESMGLSIAGSSTTSSRSDFCLGFPTRGICPLH